ncbi:hypothetical protein ASG24_07850 [Methylophilus sp. Leaf414]|nr:hypothetical protein ASG24_07850 [Methylophilus sp. Leaf414]
MVSFDFNLIHNAVVNHKFRNRMPALIKQSDISFSSGHGNAGIVNHKNGEVLISVFIVVFPYRKYIFKIQASDLQPIKVEICFIKIVHYIRFRKLTLQRLNLFDNYEVT